MWLICQLSKIQTRRWAACACAFDLIPSDLVLFAWNRNCSLLKIGLFGQISEPIQPVANIVLAEKATRWLLLKIKLVVVSLAPRIQGLQWAVLLKWDSKYGSLISVRLQLFSFSKFETGPCQDCPQLLIENLSSGIYKNSTYRRKPHFSSIQFVWPSLLSVKSI